MPKEAQEMPTTSNIRMVVREVISDGLGDSDTIIGYLSNYGCENDTCTQAIVNGRRWHAIPAGSGVTLPDYHFRDADEAITALVGVAE
jgi:hypothetical protein